MTEQRFPVALLGFGYWGRNLARNIVSHPRFSLRCVADPDAAQLEVANRLYPWIEASEDPRKALGDDQVAVAVIATPVVSHYSLTKAALQQGHHVIVTKPLARSVPEAEELEDLAGESESILLMDHTFVFTGAVVAICDVLRSGDLGDPVYCSSTRVNLGTYRRDMDVIWDLGPHDVSILDSIGCGMPAAVTATAGGRMGGRIDQVANVSLFYPEGFVANLNLSWLSPVKLRLMLIGGTRKMVVYDDMEPSEKIKIYDKGVDLSVDQNLGTPPVAEYRLGEMRAPQLDQREALSNELDHLVQAIEGSVTPYPDAASGLRCMKILQAASRSAERSGELQVLNDGGWGQYQESRSALT